MAKNERFGGRPPKRDGIEVRGHDGVRDGAGMGDTVVQPTSPATKALVFSIHNH